MQVINQRPLIITGIALVLGFVVSSPCFADAGSAAPSFFINAGGGFTVYKSEMVQSNDTSSTTYFGFGVYGGSGRTIGMMVQQEQASFAFDLNGATITTMTRDVHLRYRYGPVYLGAVLNTSQLEVTAPPDADGDDFLDQDTDAEEYMKVLNTGVGANLGANIPVGKFAFVYIDVSTVTTSLVRQSYIENAETTASGFTEKEITFGPRLDIDLGGSINLAKNWLDIKFGVKQRSFGITVDTDAYKEQTNSTYIGLLAGWNF